MPFSTRIDDGVLYTALFGLVTSGDLRDLVEVVADIERSMPVAPNRVTDLRAISGRDLGFSAIVDMVEWRRRDPPRNPIRSAIVATSLVMVGFARMFQTLNDTPKVSVEIFETPEAAERWVRGTGP